MTCSRSPQQGMWRQRPRVQSSLQGTHVAVFGNHCMCYNEDKKITNRASRRTLSWALATHLHAVLVGASPQSSSNTSPMGTRRNKQERPHRQWCLLCQPPPLPGLGTANSLLVGQILHHRTQGTLHVGCSKAHTRSSGAAHLLSYGGSTHGLWQYMTDSSSVLLHHLTYCVASNTSRGCPSTCCHALTASSCWVGWTRQQL